MNRAFRIALAVAATGILVYLSIFPLAENFTEVVVLRTLDAKGGAHETRVTLIEVQGAAWVRGRPYRGWFRRIEANPDAELFRAKAWHPVRGTISRAPEDIAAFEQVMLDDYGALYRFMDLMARMSSNEIPVRLDPREAAAETP